MKEVWLKLLDELEEQRQLVCETKREDDTRTVIENCMDIVSKADIPADARASLLEILESKKKKVKDRPLAYPASHAVRLFCADVAKCAGFESRCDWTDLLKKNPDSKYMGRYSGITGLFYL